MRSILSYQEISSKSSSKKLVSQSVPYLNKIIKVQFSWIEAVTKQPNVGPFSTQLAKLAQTGNNNIISNTKKPKFAIQ